jgi:hypothetical protein
MAQTAQPFLNKWGLGKWQTSIDDTREALILSNVGVRSHTSRSAIFFVAAILIAVFVLDADLHATAGAIFIVVTPVVSAPVRAVPASIVSIAPVPVPPPILVAIPIGLAVVAMHSPVGIHFAVFAALTVVVAATHPPVATHLTIIAPWLVAIGSLISLLLGILVRLCWNCLRRWDRSFFLLLGNRRVEARRGQQDSGEDKNTHETLLR